MNSRYERIRLSEPLERTYGKYNDNRLYIIGYVIGFEV